MEHRRAFTLIELGIVAIVTVVLAVVAVVLITESRAKSRREKDATQVRGIHQGLVLFAQGGEDSYVVPSRFDRGNTTLLDDGVTSKDLPGHMMSILIYDGFFSPDLCVSPLEANPRIQVHKNYVYNNPGAAVTPSMALWDPSFRATPDDAAIGGGSTGAPGNLSYALMPPVGNRRPKWSNTFQATEAILGNRGPAYVARGGGPAVTWQLIPQRSPSARSDTPTGAGSYALAPYGAGGDWQGHIAYNDNHITFETTPSPATTPFTFSGLPKGSRAQADNLFVNEDDSTRAACDETLKGAAGANTNNFLRLWTAGVQGLGKGPAREQSGWTGPLVEIKPWYD